MKLLHNNLLVREIKEEEKSKSGLYIPKSANRYVRVELVNFAAALDELGLEVGEVLLLNQNHSGVEVEENEEVLLIVNAGDVLSIE